MAQPDRKRLLLVLVDYAIESKTFNPHFRKSEMLARLNIDDETFNILRSSLGDRYCHMVDVSDGEARYAINLSECLTLKDRFDHEQLERRRHRELILIALLAAVISAVLSVALAKLVGIL